MSKRKDDFTRHIAAAIILFFVILTASSCATKAYSSGPELAPAPLPTYKVGTTFIYSDGAWETVTATAPGMVTWTNNRGVIFSGSPDFTYRAGKWQSQTGQGTRRYIVQKGLIARKRTSFWPLQRENAVSYTEMGNWQQNEEPARSYQSDWSCKVEGTERVSVMAGEFDAWKIVCVRYSVPNSWGGSRAKETKTWYYSPEVEHYVLMTSSYHYNRPSRRKELLAVLPPNDGIPADARRKMSKSFQQAMEFKKSGEPVSWSAPQAAVSGEIIPQGTFQLADGSYSRRYVERLKLPDGQRTYYGMAFRDSKGVWGIPRR